MTARETPAMPPSVEAAFDAFPSHIRSRLLFLRRLIFDVAASLEDVGPIEETLKWGEPAYLTSSTKSGSTIRLGHKAGDANRYALYFNCNTSLVDGFRGRFGDDFTFDGNRAILFDTDEELNTTAVSACIAAALTYHRRR